MVGFYGPKGIFVEHIKLHVYVKLHLNSACSEQAFWAVVIVLSCSSYFLGSTCTSFSVIGPSFMFLAHSSSQQFGPIQLTIIMN